MTFNLFVRRTHIYLALSLLPWFFMYGISSYFFNHPDYFAERYKNDGIPQWTVRFDRPYQIEVPVEGDLRAVGAQILKDAGLDGAFGVYRPNAEKLNVYWFNFRDATQLTYFVKEQRLLAEDRRFRWDHVFTGMHARGGFEQESWLNDAWGILVDIVCIGMLIWIATGIYMWWQIASTRFWGSLALGGGFVFYIIFLMAL
jgi:hypothetical protein